MMIPEGQRLRIVHVLFQLGSFRINWREERIWKLWNEARITY
ncbi:hypothetical protein L798_03389 [Zootermopsis nevadensis]|uniref:Uncharacterized protein n=1 Tax=Zootermopsis nevadensis TaxID=136037 RepID=A0A067RDD1_ZOONE|nr:hypothetical protein L798_03389 [Zootermopsis nevadensis]